MPRTGRPARRSRATAPRTLLAATAGALLGMTFASASAAGAPDQVCRGAAPTSQAELRGPVLHIPDGHTLCIAQGFTPDTWAPLRLADASAATGRETLMAAAFGKTVACTLEKDGSAICRLEGRSVAELAAASAEAGKAWREASGPRLQARR